MNINELRQKAEKGNTTARNELRKMANAGDVDAQMALGSCYYYGIGVQKDYNEAYKWFSEAAKKGNPAAKRHLTGLAEKINSETEKNRSYDDYDDDCEKLIRKAEYGDVEAQYTLGYELYNEGMNELYIEENENEGNKIFKEAVKWFRKAVEQGHADAQNNLGECYFYGHGVNENYNEAVKWFRKAVEQGHADAQNNLGECYFYGHGVNKNYNEAVKWFRKAAEQGHADAQNNLGECYFYGHGVNENYYEAVKWFRKAAEQDNGKAQLYLGNCYVLGAGVPQDYEKAEMWHDKAEENYHEFDEDLLREMEEAFKS